MALNKVYTRINWEDYPSENTDLDAYNLNQMDSAIDALDNRIISQDALKVDKSAINGNIADWTMNETTGVITITKYNGEKVIFDLNIEKIPVGFSMSDDGNITMTTEDGTQFTADIGSMIPVLTFEDSATIAVSVTGTGKNKTYSFSIKSGSVTGDMLQPNYLADVTVQAEKASSSASDAANSAKAAKTSETNAKSSETAAKNSETNSATNAETAISNATSASTSAINAANSAKAAKTSETNAKSSETVAKNSAANAEASETNALSSKNSALASASTAQKNANLSKSYAVGGTGTREGEDTDNAKYYMEQARNQTGGIPTKVSELENDAGYITNSVSNLTNYYDKANIDKKIDAIPKTDLTNYLTKTGDGSNLTATFSEATTLDELTTGEKLSSILGKLKLAVKNLKSLISIIGTTDISDIGDGTITGGLSDVNGKLNWFDIKNVYGEYTAVGSNNSAEICRLSLTPGTWLLLGYIDNSMSKDTIYNNSIFRESLSHHCQTVRSTLIGGGGSVNSYAITVQTNMDMLLGTYDNSDIKGNIFRGTLYAIRLLKL